jgi:hypothetical protein
VTGMSGSGELCARHFIVTCRPIVLSHVVRQILSQTAPYELNSNARVLILIFV